MLDFYPYLVNEWIEKQKKEVEELARKYAEGDEEVYRDTYSSEISRIDCYNEEQLFNQAMLIMIYSYYESTLLRLAKEIKEDEARPSVIANHFGVILDDELLNISNYLFKTILPLRNELCHNNNGTLYSREKDNERAIAELERKKYLFIDNDGISIIDRSFIKKVLIDEHKLLLKLAEICGYKTTRYGYKDGSMTPEIDTLSP